MFITIEVKLIFVIILEKAREDMIVISGIIEIDIHGMTKLQAKKYLDSQIAGASKNVYRIRVVHGYNNGTELRDMVRKSYKSGKNPKVLRTDLGLNPGETDLVLKEF